MVKYSCLVLVAIFLLAGPYGVVGSCENDLTEAAKYLQDECNAGEIADEFLPFSEEEVGEALSDKPENVQEVTNIVKGCFEAEQAKEHGKCERFSALSECYIEKNLCKFF
ncbi:uncharacterized protein LOC129793635 [Lutzomyia longipalpis]|uniref:uncharacterized protein LOC129793635 n=1 Tax=Lutzomyia longipalpis TaxID=7200 RepID=UPI00248412D0|nr:uncharacterized protein LOC129793635 [Lutzomyia longipalpis]